MGTNTAALTAAKAITMSQRSIETSMERLSTGKRLNSAADDAAGVAITSRLTSNLKGINQSIRNAMDAQALIDTAEGGLQETEALLQRIRELAVQAASDTNSSADRAALDAEKTQLMAEIDRIANSTTWAGQNLLDGTFSNKSFQVGGGTMAMDSLSSSISDMSGNGLSLSSNDITTPQKVDSEFRINTFSSGDQEHPTIASLKDGSSLVVWESYGQDGSADGIVGRFLDKNKNPSGDEFIINQNTTGFQTSPSIAELSDGSIVVAWSGTPSGHNDVKAQKLTSTGQLIGSEFTVNTETANGQQDAKLQALADGGFIAVWQSYGQDGSENSIHGQRFDSSGSRVGSEFLINTTTASYQRSPSVTVLNNGGFVVAWQSYNQDGDQEGVFAQQFDNSFNQVGSEIQINTYTNGNQDSVNIVALNSGGFVAAWDDYERENIYAQIFDETGNKLNTEFQVNDDTSSIKIEPELVKLTDGFLIAWNSRYQDGSEYGVFAQRFSDAGGKIGSEFQMNTETTDWQIRPSLAAYEDGTLLAAWGSKEQDGSGYGIFSQLFDLGSTKINLNTAIKSKSSISLLDVALQTLNSQRASLGALSNRIDHIVSNNTNTATNIARSISRIEDADFASETTNLAKQQILQQAATAMLAQANASKQNILTLLQM
ncbi:flagellin [Rhodobacteraceae bacterium]|nr:flagellin [Paracoccaceae bacterium]